MKFSKLNYLLIYIAFFISFSFSQSGHFISGKVVDKDNAPLFGANIILKGTFMGSTSDIEGNYRIDNIEDQFETYKRCRQMEKLIDELAKGRKMEKILRAE